MIKKFLNLTAACLLLVATLVTAVPAQASAHHNPNHSGGGGSTTTPPEQLCTTITAGLGYEAKVDTIGDPATVTVTAPTGFLIDSYCVKAANDPVIVVVTPPSATVIIDHPTIGSVSHYQIHLIPKPQALLATASVDITPATCELGETLTYDVNAWANATLGASSTPTGTTGPAPYSVTANATANAEFSGATTVKTFTGTLAGPLDDPRCDPEVLEADASVSISEATCDDGEILTYNVNSWLNATLGAGSTPSGTEGAAAYEVTANAAANAEFDDNTTVRTFSGNLDGPLTGEQCEEPEVLEAEASVNVTPADCETPGKLTYDVNSWLNAVLLGGSTPTGTTGPAAYEVTANATANAEFDDGKSTRTFSGNLEAQLSSDDCVLGETPEEPEEPTIIPGTPETPDVLPATSSQSLTSMILAITGFVALVALGAYLIRLSLRRI